MASAKKKREECANVGRREGEIELKHNRVMDSRRSLVFLCLCIAEGVRKLFFLQLGNLVYDARNLN